MLHNTLSCKARCSVDTIISIEKFLNRDITTRNSAQKKDDQRKNINESLLYSPEDLNEYSFETEDEDEREGEGSASAELLNWGNFADEFEGTNFEMVRKRWLRKSLISMSMNMDILVICTAQKFVILERSKRPTDGLNSMEMAARVEIEHGDDRTFILSLAVFGVQPPQSNSSSQSLTTDWTCICIGLSTGELMFYTERGTLIFTERCANCPILSLRLGHSILPGNQELVALTSAAKLVIIEGLSLYTTLRTARAQIARGDRSFSEICGNLQLNAHQLKLDRYEHVGDFQSIGLTRPGTFDQYMSAFYSAGRSENVYRSQLPIYAQYLCTPATKKKTDGGENSEFVSFLWHDTQPVVGTLSDAIFSLTSHITNNIPSFGFRSFTGLGTSRKDRSVKKSAADVRTNWVPIKSILRDGKRSADRTFIAPTPGWPFVAVSDNYGRIVLVNTRTRRIIRIWKGYRQARCAWIETVSTSRTTPMKKALFLAIFAPKRGLLEIWSMLNGPRVLAFQVEEGSRLLSLPVVHSGILFGGSDIRETEAQEASGRAGAVFLTPDGLLYSVDVPFYLSALSTSATSIYDEHLIKDFSLEHFMIKTENADNESDVDLEKLAEFALRIKTNLARQRFLEALIVSSRGTSTKKSDAGNKKGRRTLISVRSLRELVNRMVGKDKVATDKSEFDCKQQSSVFPYLLALHSAIDFYSILDEKFTDCISTDDQPIAEIEACVKHLSQIQCDRTNPLLAKALSILEFVNDNNGSSAIASSLLNIANCRLELNDFVGFFNLNLYQTFDNNAQIGTPITAKYDENNLSTKIPANLLAKLGATLFAPFFVNSFSDFESFLKSLTSKFRLRKDFFVTSLCAFWLYPPCNFKLDCFSAHFAEFMFGLFNLLVEDSDNSNWTTSFKETLKTIEQMVIESTNVPAALMVVVQMGDLCQKMSVTLNERKASRGSEQKTPTEDGDAFIVFDKPELELYSELCNELPSFWAFLSLHLSVLHLLQWLSQQMADESLSSQLSASNFSVAKLLQKGVGFYREQLGLWVSNLPTFSAHGIVSLFSSDVHSENNTDEIHFDAKIFHALRLLCKGTLPHNLRLELILCDCVWECASAWYKDESRRVTKLKRSIDLLQFLNSVPKLQNGMALLLWDTFIASSFKKCFLLIEEQMGSAGPGRSDGGTLPLMGKDRLLRRDVLIVERDLPDYTSCIRKFLEMLAESCCHLCSRQDIAYGPLAGSLHSEDPELTDFICHHKFKQHSSFSERKFAGNLTGQTLIQLIDCQKSVNYHLALHMSHLAAVIELQINLATNAYPKPSSLFDSNGKRAFFNPFHTHPLLPMGRVDDRTKTRRQRFIEQCMEAHGRENERTGPSSERCRELRKVIDRLTKEWALNVTTLQVNEVTRLYLNGADEEAEVKCDKLSGNRQKLALELVPVISGRIKLLNEKSRSALFDKIGQSSAASPGTMTFINDTPDEYLPNFDQIDSKRIRRLVALSGSCLVEKSGRSQQMNRRDENQTMEFSKCQQLLREFNEICNVIDWMENRK
ncbi:hypothetical protein niasHS_010651 [Heterodera schachtii]|uniref:Rab3 GTPase-activating protein non-catalytic subunit n=1 Tax=Heterodera schachtii TaxID=97005 RepID=A0ABD2IS63_HETSC